MAKNFRKIREIKKYKTPQNYSKENDSKIFKNPKKNGSKFSKSVNISKETKKWPKIYQKIGAKFSKKEIWRILRESGEISSNKKNGQKFQENVTEIFPANPKKNFLCLEITGEKFPENF